MQDSTLQEIKDRLNIADVIAGYIPIKKSGANFKAPCPFHNEKTPSLMISTQKQIWHCFGCGEGGDVFGFVMKYESLEFKEALKLLADKAGVKLPTYSPADKQGQDEKDLLFRINNFAARYYNQVLRAKQGVAALEYLKNRGLNEATINKWQIGFAPDDFHTLEKALTAKKVASADLIKAGVSSKNDRGQMYDRFRGRITFPIYNYFGETVGFSARLLNDNANAAKYVNSPETSIYNKSKILFGLNFAKEAIRKADEAVLVEGQMDCIQAHQAGFANIVAVSGTALTEQHFIQLGRLTKNLKFCFDSDTAGQAASRRAGEMALRAGFRLKLIVLKAVKDPDELLRKSPGLWAKAAAEALWFLDYYIDLAEINFVLGSVEQKHYLSQEVVPFLQFIQDPLEQDHYIHKMATKFLISEKVIRDQIKPANQLISKPANQLISKPANQLISKPANQLISKPANVPGLLLQKEVLGGLLFLEDFANEIKSKIFREDFEDSTISQLVELWLNSSGQAIEVKQSALAKEAIFMVESQLEDLEGDAQKLKKSLEKSFALLKLNALKHQQQVLQSEIKTAEIKGDKQRLQELNHEFASIVLLRIEFEKKV